MNKFLAIAATLMITIIAAVAQTNIAVVKDSVTKDCDQEVHFKNTNNTYVGTIPEAPSNGTQYVRQNKGWAPVSSSGGGDVYLSGTNIFRGPSNTFEGTLYATNFHLKSQGLVIDHPGYNMFMENSLTPVVGQSFSTWMGYGALNNGGAGAGNTAFGFQAGAGQGGNTCVAFGYTALYNALGNNNTAMGSAALNGSSGNSNVGIGDNAGTGKGATNCTFVGAYAGNTMGGDANTAVGQNAGGAAGGANNIAIGAESFRRTIGTNAIAIGTGAASDTTNAYEIIAIGYLALYRSLGMYNVAVGPGAGWDLIGTENDLMGLHAGMNVIGSYSVAIGSESQRGNVGDENVGVGYYTLYAGTGSYNVAIGSMAGRNSGGESNTWLGVRAGYSATSATNYTNVTCIGAGTMPKGSRDHMVIGLPNQTVYIDGNLVTPNMTAMDQAFTVYTNFSMVATNTTNFSVQTIFNAADIVRGRLYVADTNTIPFSKTATLTFREQDLRASGTAIWQSDMLISAVTNAGAIAIGATNMMVADGTDFSANSLVYISGTTNEFVRLLNVSGNNLIFKYACTNNHAASNVVSRVREFGGFNTFDSAGTKKIWGSIDWATNMTVNLKMEMTYSK